MSTPQVGIIMGSDSDWETMKAAADICEKFNIPYEKKVLSAHRTPDDMTDYAKAAKEAGVKIIIAAALKPIEDGVRRKMMRNAVKKKQETNVSICPTSR